MSTFKTVAQELAAAFTSDTRSDGTVFYKLKDERAAWISKDYEEGPVGKAHSAVDDRLPDDWIYEQCACIADTLTEYDDADDARDHISEIADGEVDTYNAARSAWLASHLGNLALCDEAMEDFGSDYPEGGISQIIALGQFKALEAITGALIDAIEDEAQARDDDAERAEEAETE